MATLENHLNHNIYMITVNRLFQYQLTTLAPVYIHTQQPHARVMKICTHV